MAATQAEGIGGRVEADEPVPFDYGRAAPTNAGSRTTDEPTEADATGDDDGLVASVGATISDRKQRFDDWQQRHRTIALPLAVLKKFSEDRAGNLAALVAYYGFLSLFPLLLVFLTVLGFALSSRPDLQQSIVDSALAQFPVVGDQLRSNVTSVRGSGLALVIGVLVSLWAGMGATNAMQDAMNTIWEVPLQERGNFFVTRLRSLGILAVIALSVLGSTVLSSVAAASAALGPFGRGGVLVVAFAFNVGVFLLLFKLLTNRPTTFRSLLPGAAIAGGVWVLLQLFGTAYVQHVVSGASQTYGTFAVVLGLVSYLYLQAQLTIYAAELNTVLTLGRWPRPYFGDAEF